jgi:hypothetical protein
MGMVFSMASIAKDTLSEIIVNNKERREREAEEKAQRELEVRTQQPQQEGKITCGDNRFSSNGNTL